METQNNTRSAEKKNHLFRNMVIVTLVLFVGATIIIAMGQPKLFTAALTFVRTSINIR